jgi:photosystem II stability/assembly factor-like uncharacterized protein
MAAPFRDPLDTPAQATRLLASSQLAAVARVGQRVVAVGVRGRIMTSDDGGQSWRQAKVPVSTELVAVQFVGPKEGWAVGHGGVVLHTADAGETWEKQLDGRQTKELLLKHFKPKADAGDEAAARMVGVIELNYAEGPEQALLGVWFDDANNGFVCGSFGTLLATRDGGKTWESWTERIDVREPVHLNAIRGVGGEIFIASERGVVYRLDRQAQMFVPHETGYRGSFFGIAGAGSMVFAYGLRGTVYRSTDMGRSWSQVDVGARASINGATALQDGQMLFVTQDGQALLGEAGSAKFRSLPLQQRGLFQDAVQIDRNTALLVGWNGPQVISLQ